MSFLDRYEFEQILDEDLAVSRNQWQDETVNAPQQLSSTPRLQTRIWRIVLLGLAAGSLGLTLLHQPSFAQHPPVKSDQVALIQQK